MARERGRRPGERASERASKQASERVRRRRPLLSIWLRVFACARRPARLAGWLRLLRAQSQHARLLLLHESGARKLVAPPNQPGRAQSMNPFFSLAPSHSLCPLFASLSLPLARPLAGRPPWNSRGGQTAMISSDPKRRRSIERPGEQLRASKLIAKRNWARRCQRQVPASCERLLFLPRRQRAMWLGHGLASREKDCWPSRRGGELEPLQWEADQIRERENRLLLATNPIFFSTRTNCLRLSWANSWRRRQLSEPSC